MPFCCSSIMGQPQAAPKRGQLDLGDLLQDLDGQNPPPLFCTVMGECTSAQVTAGSPLLQVHALQPICHLLLPGQSGSLRCNPSKPKPGQWIFCIGFPFTLNVAMEQNDSTSCFVFLGNVLFILIIYCMPRIFLVFLGNFSVFLHFKAIF